MILAIQKRRQRSDAHQASQKHAAFPGSQLQSQQSGEYIERLQRDKHGQ